MAQRFAGRVAIVTGASRGIGFEIARRLRDEGARVCLTARRPDGLAEAARALGPQTLTYAGKTHEPDHRAEAVAGTLERFGRIDILVNNAGTNPVYGPLMDLELSAAAKTVEVNALAALGWVQQAYRGWMAEHGGVVLNVASAAGLKPAHGIGAYGASKAMLLHLTQQLAVELAPNVRVNALAPATVKTRFATALYEGRESEVAAGYPMQRLGIPEDIGGAAVFALSDEASWMTGQTVVLDGGVTLTGGL